jgi:excinuclease ABC subunit A
MAGTILVRNAREHNLKGVDLDLPRERLVVVTGVSGSGKSSLAVDTLFRFGERRYLEGISPRLRAHLGGGARPEVDRVEGLPPTLCVPADPPPRDPRSTLASLADVLDYLRVLWAVAGEALCHLCGRPVARRSPGEVADAVAAMPEGTKVLLLAPLFPGPAKDAADAVERARKEGFVRVRVDGEVHEIDGAQGTGHRARGKEVTGEVAAVVDRIVVRGSLRSRLQDSVEVALKASGGTVVVARDGAPPRDDLVFSARFGCPRCGTSGEPPSPASFSWWSPRGACPACTGTGIERMLPPDVLVPPDAAGTLLARLQTAFARLPPRERKALHRLAETFLETRRLGPGTLVSEVPRAALEEFLQAAVAPRLLALAAGKARSGRGAARALLAEGPCGTCAGTRLRPESRAVRVGGRSLPEFLALSVAEATPALAALRFDGAAAKAAAPLVEEASRRVGILAELGLGYLGLDRPAATLSGGEAQRTRLAAHLGGGLAGVCYVLDEPTAGLHPAEVERLLAALRRLRDAGNSLLVVEHDTAVMAAADWIVEFGPGAGKDGGSVVFSGPREEFGRADTLTARHLRGEARTSFPTGEADPFARGAVVVVGARAHNLRDVDVKLPVGKVTAVVGVSGSGKSSLVVDVLLRALRRLLHGDPAPPGPHREIRGARRFTRAYEVDRSPVGRSARATPATFVGAWDAVRDLLAATDAARVRGFDASRFSFNVEGGRCPACEGLGVQAIEMHLLPDVRVTCEACGGRRFERETLEVAWRGASAAEILRMTVAEALLFFRNVPGVRDALLPVDRVGIGYLPLGQPLETLSGGERQRLRLAGELAGRPGEGSVFVLDEPSVGLHPADVARLAGVLRDLAKEGATILLIDHDPDLIRTADWVVELGPGAGGEGGRITAQGRPRDFALTSSMTGSYIR